MMLGPRSARQRAALAIAGAALVACGVAGCGGEAGGRDGGLGDAGGFDGAARDGAAGADAAARDGAAGADAATPVDASAGAATVGAAALAQRAYMQAPATGTLTTAAVTTRTGSTLLVSLARGTWAAAPDAPTDGMSNGYARVGDVHTYASWPTSATALYQKSNALGGAGHTFSMTWGDVGSGDEVTLSAVEVIGGGAVEDASWVERAAASSLTSGSVHVSGKAVLVAWWWGSGGVRPVGSRHVAVPGGGFQVIPAATGLASISSSGYVQVASAWRLVTTPGDYTVTWTTDGEGAQLYLVAVQVP
ncbi:MAG: hypothetical protein IT370_22905 [Deltaproteobacteria bacterium]|nr:hypothetical protein [Deltaproteobacteria bacterium]